MGLVQIFWIFFAVNFVTIGGGYVMLPILHQVFVEHYRLLTDKEFLDAIALGQITPGPLTLMNAFIGFKLKGLAGAVAATAGTYLPSMLVVTLATKYYLKFKDSRVLAAVFAGIKPAIIGMLAAVALMLGKTSIGEPVTLAIGLAAFILMSFTRVDPTLVIIGAGVAGAVF